MLQDGSQEKLASADAKMNAFNGKIGNVVRVHCWYQMQGANADTPEFYQAQWCDSLKAKGAIADSFITNGGVQMPNALYADLMQCEAGPSFLYNFVGR